MAEHFSTKFSANHELSARLQRIESILILRSQNLISKSGNPSDSASLDQKRNHAALISLNC